MAAQVLRGAEYRHPVAMAAASIDWIKWLAVALMVVDHINKFVFKEGVPGMYAMGRVAMPLFMFVLGYNLARPGVLQAGVYKRVWMRLMLFGALAAVPHAVLNALAWGWWPANIMFTMAAGVAVVWLLDGEGLSRLICAGVVFVLAGALVEFWWPAMALCICTWAFFRRPGYLYLLGFMAGLAALYFINGNFWAFAVLPIIALARYWVWPVPRAKWFFYAFYPLHFVIIWGYLRFAA
jgi:TraX protein